MSRQLRSEDLRAAAGRIEVAQQHVLMSPPGFQQRCCRAVALVGAKCQAVALGKVMRLQIEDPYGPQSRGSPPLVYLAEVAHDMNRVFVMVAPILAHWPSIVTPRRGPSHRARSGGLPGLGR